MTSSFGFPLNTPLNIWFIVKSLPTGENIYLKGQKTSAFLMWSDYKLAGQVCDVLNSINTEEGVNYFVTNQPTQG